MVFFIEIITGFIRTTNFQQEFTMSCENTSAHINSGETIG